jgi:ubiquitin-small subunit ribosomal protein S27Ae
MANEEKKGEKTPKHKTSTKWSAYEPGSELKRKLKNCPKCGAGVFMAKHKDREYCGKCHYTSFSNTNVEA